MNGKKQTVFSGKAWVITEADGKLVDNIDTDMIFHNAHLAITDISKMGQHAFGNLQGWEDFPKKAGKGDILILGKNFGAGSSRQQAVDCFTALGVSCLVAESFGAIYKRNAINSGMPILCREGFANSNGALAFSNGDLVEVDLEKSEIRNKTKNFTAKLEPFTKVQMDIYQEGGLYAYGKKLQSAAA
ncbi:MAG: 3-isopropylmalate dehydratase [Candidatus Riflebacteria bacterium]|nr:3-isopropylmalate dehydratase [Candidatus Riflebacteria bacterium]